VLTDFQNSFTIRLSRKFVTKSYLNTPPHRKRAATLPCILIHWQKVVYFGHIKNPMTHSTLLLQQRKDVAAQCRTSSSRSVSDCVNPFVSKSKVVFSCLISVDNNQIKLLINITAISNSVSLSYTSYSTFLASSASFRTKVQGEYGSRTNQPCCL